MALLLMPMRGGVLVLLILLVGSASAFLPPRHRKSKLINTCQHITPDAVGSLSTTCAIPANIHVTLASGTRVVGNGTLTIGNNTVIDCSDSDEEDDENGASNANAPQPCEISIHVNNSIILNTTAQIKGSTIELYAKNTCTLSTNSSVNVTARGTDAPSTASASGSNAGGGNGGTGAVCSSDSTTQAGKAAGWGQLTQPTAHGGDGNGEKPGRGGGSVSVTCDGGLVLAGCIEANGGNAIDGGGGAGGSIVVSAPTVVGSPSTTAWLTATSITAAGGDGFTNGKKPPGGGGAGGRVAILSDAVSPDVRRWVSGGHSEDVAACDHAQSGGAGTRFENQGGGTLYVSNAGSDGYASWTETPTPAGHFPRDGEMPPPFGEVVVQGGAKLSVVPGHEVFALTNIVANHGTITANLDESDNGAPLVLVTTHIYVGDGGSISATGVPIRLEQLTGSEGSLELDAKATVSSTLDSSKLNEPSFVFFDTIKMTGGSSMICSGDLEVRGTGNMKIGTDADAHSGAGNSIIQSQRLSLSGYVGLHVGKRGSILSAQPGSSSTTFGKRNAAACPNAPNCSALPPHESPCGLSFDPDHPLDGSFSLQLCRIETIEIVGGIISAPSVLARRVHAVNVSRYGAISADALGCGAGEGPGAGGGSADMGGGGGHGGHGGSTTSNSTNGTTVTVQGGSSYGLEGDTPCEMGSGGGGIRGGSGGGVIVLGTKTSPLWILILETGGSITSDGSTAGEMGGGGGAGGTVSASIDWRGGFRADYKTHFTAVGGQGGSGGGGGGGGGVVHVQWTSPAPVEATFEGSNVSQGVLSLRGGEASSPGLSGRYGFASSSDCPPGRAGELCDPCPIGTYKTKWGSDVKLCKSCPDPSEALGAVTWAPANEGHIPDLPNGTGAFHLPCQYTCVSRRVSPPSCAGPLARFVDFLGGPGPASALAAVVAAIFFFPLALSRRSRAISRGREAHAAWQLGAPEAIVRKSGFSQGGFRAQSSEPRDTSFVLRTPSRIVAVRATPGSAFSSLVSPGSTHFGTPALEEGLLPYDESPRTPRMGGRMADDGGLVPEQVLATADMLWSDADPSSAENEAPTMSLSADVTPGETTPTSSPNSNGRGIGASFIESLQDLAVTRGAAVDSIPHPRAYLSGTNSPTDSMVLPPEPHEALRPYVRSAEYAHFSYQLTDRLRWPQWEILVTHVLHILNPSLEHMWLRRRRLHHLSRASSVLSESDYSMLASVRGRALKRGMELRWSKDASLAWLEVEPLGDEPVPTTLQCATSALPIALATTGRGTYLSPLRVPLPHEDSYARYAATLTGPALWWRLTCGTNVRLRQVTRLPRTSAADGPLFSASSAHALRSLVSYLNGPVSAALRDRGCRASLGLDAEAGRLSVLLLGPGDGAPPGVMAASTLGAVELDQSLAGAMCAAKRERGESWLSRMGLRIAGGRGGGSSGNMQRTRTRSSRAVSSDGVLGPYRAIPSSEDDISDGDIESSDLSASSHSTKKWFAHMPPSRTRMAMYIVLLMALLTALALAGCAMIYATSSAAVYVSLLCPPLALPVLPLVILEIALTPGPESATSLRLCNLWLTRASFAAGAAAVVEIVSIDATDGIAIWREQPLASLLATMPFVLLSGILCMCRVLCERHMRNLYAETDNLGEELKVKPPTTSLASSPDRQVREFRPTGRPPRFPHSSSPPPPSVV